MSKSLKDLETEVLTCDAPEDMYRLRIELAHYKKNLYSTLENTRPDVQHLVKGDITVCEAIIEVCAKKTDQVNNTFCQANAAFKREAKKTLSIDTFNRIIERVNGFKPAI